MVITEEWKEVKDWNGKYLISNLGRFKSIDGKYTKKHPDGYITLGTIGNSGYRAVTLRNCGLYYSVRVHTLVGEHFCDKPSSVEKLCINHIDGNKLNNNFWNLEWITLGENVKHAVRIGLMDLKGEKHFRAKLTNEKVIEMRRLRANGLTHQRIADMFGVSRRQAGDVIKGINWGWLKEGLSIS
jgi:hypothetical protein